MHIFLFRDNGRLLFMLLLCPPSHFYTPNFLLVVWVCSISSSSSYNIQETHKQEVYRRVTHQAVSRQAGRNTRGASRAFTWAITFPGSPARRGFDQSHTCHLSLRWKPRIPTPFPPSSLLSTFLSSALSISLLSALPSPLSPSFSSFHFPLTLSVSLSSLPSYLPLLSSFLSPLSLFLSLSFPPFLRLCCPVFLAYSLPSVLSPSRLLSVSNYLYLLFLSFYFFSPSHTTFLPLLPPTAHPPFLRSLPLQLAPFLHPSVLPSSSPFLTLPLSLPLPSSLPPVHVKTRQLL